MYWALRFQDEGNAAPSSQGTPRSGVKKPKREHPWHLTSRCFGFRMNRCVLLSSVRGVVAGGSVPALSVDPVTGD